MTARRILHVVGDSDFGGAAALITRLAVAAGRDGWQVDVLATNPAFAAHLARHGVRVVHLDAVRRAIGPRDVSGFARLVRFLARERYDVVHTHTSKAGFVGRAAARAAAVPVTVHTAHGFAVHEASPPLQVAAYAALERLAGRWCDVVVFVSEFHREWARRLRFAPDHRLVVIGNGVDEAALAPTAGCRATRLTLGAADDDVLVLNFGRLAGGKGIETLLAAVAPTVERAPSTRFVVAGDGPMAEDHRQLARRLGAEGSVTFLGFRADVADLLAAADVVVLPSQREGMSIALLEAMAAGRCIVASSIGSMSEALADTGVLVPPLDAPALASAVVDLAGDPARRDRLGRAAAARQRTRYREDAMLRSYLDLYAELAAAAGRGAVAPGGAGDGAGGGDPVVRPVTAADAAAIGDLHHAAFPAFFLSSLGPGFLRAFYRALLREPWALGIGAFDGGRCVGFAVGGATSEGFYRRLLRRHPWALLRPALPRLVARPRRAVRLVAALRRSPYALEAGDAVLLSLCTDPAARRRSIGRAVVAAFEGEARRHGRTAVVLTTDATGNDGVNAFYRRAGYLLDGEATNGGRAMNRYRKRLGDGAEATAAAAAAAVDDGCVRAPAGAARPA